MNRGWLSRIALFTALAAVVVFAYVHRQQLDAAALRLWVREAGALGPLLYMAGYAIAAVLFLPGSIITLAGGALFGPVWGTLYSLTGATVGATAAFLIARYFAGDWMGRKASGWVRQAIGGVEQEGWRFVAFVRLVPLFPFNLLNYVLGLTRIPIAQYVLASYIFMFPGALAYTYLGYAGREAAAGGEALVQKGLIALALLGAVAFLPRIVRRLRRAPAPIASAKVSSAELKQRLDRREDITVLDVRTANDYAGELGHVRGALNVPLEQLTGRLSELNGFRDRPLAVICRSSRMSAKAVELLQTAGFRQALLVDDGMLGWRQHGFPTEHEGAPAGPN